MIWTGGGEEEIGELLVDAGDPLLVCSRPFHPGGRRSRIAQRKRVLVCEACVELAELGCV